MTYSIEFNGYSPGTGGYGFWPIQAMRAAASPAGATPGAWIPVAGIWAAHNGQFQSLTGAANSDAYVSAEGDTSDCSGGVGGDQAVYRRWVEFSSPMGTTMEVQVQWLLDGANDGSVDTLTFGVGVHGPIRSTHVFEYLGLGGPGTGVDDGSDHDGNYSWRRRNNNDGVWGPWYVAAGGFGSPMGWMACGR